MQKSKQRQLGASMSGIMLGLAILALLATVAIKLAPHYMSFMTVRSVMNDVHEDPEAAKLGRKALLDRINRMLYINGVKAVTNDNFTFTRLKRINELSVDYEVREHLFGNLDAMLVFSHQIQFDR